MVGARGFEPPTPCSQSRCASRLRHAPNIFHISLFPYPNSSLFFFSLRHPAWRPPSPRAGQTGNHRRVSCRQARNDRKVQNSINSFKTHLTVTGQTGVSLQAIPLRFGVPNSLPTFSAEVSILALDLFQSSFSGPLSLSHHPWETDTTFG